MATLRQLGATDDRLDPALLDRLLERAGQQQRTLEERRIRQAEAAMSTATR
ncbi:hypothetical protein ACWEN3_35610 [Streptomyces sp. NPDC004561]